MEWEGAAFPLIMEAAEMESPSSLEEEKLPCIFNDAQQCIALLSQCQELKEKEGEILNSAEIFFINYY